MGNMGYCRFQNTLADLRDCRDHIDDTDLSEEEEAARKRLVKVCQEILEQYEPAGCAQCGRTDAATLTADEDGFLLREDCIAEEEGDD